MTFYLQAVELDKPSKDLCVIVTRFGTFKYNPLPRMGVKQPPDFEQEIMEDVLEQGINECDIYIEDVGDFNDYWDNHLKTLECILTHL